MGERQLLKTLERMVVSSWRRRYVRKRYMTPSYFISPIPHGIWERQVKKSEGDRTLCKQVDKEFIPATDVVDCVGIRIWRGVTPRIQNTPKVHTQK